FAVWLVLAYVVPLAMTRYAPFTLRPGLGCVPQGGGQIVIISGVPTVVQAATCQTLAELYRRPFTELFVDGMFRSLALLAGAAVLAVIIGTLLGATAALLRRRALASGGILAATSLVTAVPAFFVAYFLQITVIVLGAGNDGGRLLPVFGFGYDEHIVLPLLSISLPAIAYTAQLTATRMGEVLDADFI